MAERKSKKQTTGKQPSPPLHDKRWQTLIMAHHTRSEQLIGKRLASHASSQLMEKLRSGELPCMRESRKDPSVREAVTASFCQNFNIYVEPDHIQIRVDRSIQPATQRDLGEIHDWVFYIWKPDYDRLWPPANGAQEKTEMSQRRKTGPPPTHDWPLVVAAEVIRRIRAPGKKEPTVREMIDYCEKTFPDEYSPGLKEMQVLLKKLLLGQF